MAWSGWSGGDNRGQDSGTGGLPQRLPGGGNRGTISIGELAVATGWSVLYEVENGNFRLTSASESIAGKGELKPLREYLMTQGGFKNVTEEQTNQLQDWVDRRWQRFLERAGKAQ